MRQPLQYGGDVPYVTPVTEERAAYNEVVAMYKDAYASGQSQIAILKSELRSEVNLGVQNVIEWNLRSDQPNPGMTGLRTTENRLDINDAFVVRQISVLFGVQSAEKPDSWVKLSTWENPLVFTGGIYEAVRQAYNGTLSMEVNTVRYLDGLGASAFRYVDTAQEGVEISGPTPGTFQASAWEQNKAWVTMVPQFRVHGSDKTRFSLTIPDTADFSAFEDAKVVATLILRGLKVQNGGTYRSTGR
jgi:hypothetical protein